MLTAFLIIIGFGYLAAVANIHHRHQLADGREGMSLDDIRAVYGGLAASREAGAEVPSRMLTMIRGAMREYLSSDEDFSVLEGWLKAGAAPAALDQGAGRQTPRRVLLRNCLRCHARSTGTEISRQSDFGEDEFDVDPARLARFTAAGPQATTGPAVVPPQYTLPRLVLVSHIHMLAIPVFALVVGALFAVSRFPPRPRAVLTPLPMLGLVIDFGSWWLARVSGGFIVGIAAAGAAFGVAFGLQLLVILVDLWRPAASAPPAGRTA
jgi:hypothetical protein